MILTFSKSSAPNTATALDQRKDFYRAAKEFYERAQHHANKGELSKAGSNILRALAMERKAKVSGPQVLQLIKPSS